MVEQVDKKMCTSRTYKGNAEKYTLCGEELLILTSEDGETETFICPNCEALERWHREVRERIREQ